MFPLRRRSGIGVCLLVIREYSKRGPFMELVHTLFFEKVAFLLWWDPTLYLINDTSRNCFLFRKSIYSKWVVKPLVSLQGPIQGLV